MKVLITSLSAGSGHVRAAEAIRTAFQRSAPDVEAVHVDVADFVAPPFRRLYVGGYEFAVNHTPSLWGQIYRYWDTPPDDNVLLPLLQRAQRACASSFFAYLHSFRPDRIVTTHFLIPQLLATDHGVRCLQPNIETVITDFDVHRFWVSDITSRYYVAHEDTAAALARCGVPTSKITASGIPVHPCFSDNVSTASVYRELNLDPQVPVVLMLAGGLGLNELQHAVEKLFSLPGRTQIITVAGKNASLKARLDLLTPPSSIRLVNLGYVRNMHELLTISDLVITKPGGLTLSECLAKKKLMILFSPIPGQEERNLEFLVSRGAALHVRRLDELPLLANRLLTDSALRHQVLTQVKACSQPHAAYSIAESILRTSRLAA